MFVEAPGSAEGGQFAVAVAGHGVGGNAERIQHVHGADADCSDGRLGSLGGAQSRLLSCRAVGVEGGRGINEVGEPGAIWCGKAVVSAGDALQ